MVRRSSTKPDILGCNCYPIHAQPKPGETAYDKETLEKSAKNAAELVKKAILDSQTYFDLPVYLTETSGGLTTDAKIAYINALYEMVVELRQQKVPLVGVNWWPLFDTIQWDYRENPGKPLADFIVPGGWNNGLYITKPDADGNLKRVPTSAVEAYQEVVRKKI